LTGYEVLLNTSFNIKGKPLLNRVSAALHILDTHAMDYVLIEDWLFEKRREEEEKK
jgi:carbamoyltransferase